LTVNVKLSRQLLKQSNARAIVPSELSRVVAVALGGGIVNGIGNAGQPTGILNAGITSAPGTSLAYGGIVTATQTVADANGVLDPANCAWITTPTVAGLLKNRFRNGTGSDPVWMGNIPLGTIEGAPAYATRLMPPGTALYGDFSGVTVFEYPSGALIEVDPFTGFQSGIYNVKLTLYVDVVVGYLPSFYSITSIT
jgi:HK97 family phage major capsid protein